LCWRRRDAGITGWHANYPVLGYRVDVGFPVQRVAVEIDGWAWHSDSERFRQDRQRQNAMVNAGWRVLRFTWHDLAEQPDAVIDQIRRELARTWGR